MSTRSSRSSGSVAMDDYLEQILHLIDEKGYARPVNQKEDEVEKKVPTPPQQKTDKTGEK